MRSITLLSLISAPLALSSSHGHDARRHHEIGKRTGAEINLHKRFDDVRLTFYNAGMGACGKTNSASDYIVALNHEQYGNGEYCFKTITITVGRKTVQATIVDECMGCPYGALDLSRGLFDDLGSESTGVLSGSWEFGSGGDGGSDSSSSSTPKPTSTSSSTHRTSSSSSSSSRTHWTTSSSTSSKISSTSTLATPTSTAINYSTGDASGLASPTGFIGSGITNNINDLNQAIVNIGAMIVAGGNQN